MADKKQATPFLFGFTAFTSKALSETEPVMMSPTSILLKNPFWSESNSPKSSPSKDPRNGCLKFDTEGVGLGIIDSLTEDFGNPREKKLIAAKRPENSRLVLFGSQLKIQIPTPLNNFAVDSPKSPMEFGIKTRNSQLGLVSPSNCGVKCSNLGPDTPGSISAAEMELSEDYTCVISRGGPVTKTTRIFDNCVVDSCFGDAPGGGGGGSSPFARIDESMVSVSPDGPIGYPSVSFLSFCHTCRKNLDHGTDIYMFRREKAFCSDECRYEGMMMEENHGAPGVEESESW